MVPSDTDYDLEQVLKPEWRRLNVAPMGIAGLCALWLTQRLLDPVPAGNSKLADAAAILPAAGTRGAYGVGGCRDGG